MGVLERLAQVRAGVADAARAAGRDPADVTLIAVSKTFPTAPMVEAHTLGQVHFGESRGQELRDKARELAHLDLRWHYIGRIQSNKAKYIAPNAFRVHALETQDQAHALAARAPAPLHCLLAVNIGREAQKSGVLPEQALDRCRELVTAGSVQLCGLMCLPPAGVDPAPFYQELADLAQRGRADGLPLHELSMGMSGDYATAVAHGATWVRVGTAIFGAR